MLVLGYIHGTQIFSEATRGSDDIWECFNEKSVSCRAPAHVDPGRSVPSLRLFRLVNMFSVVLTRCYPLSRVAYNNFAVNPVGVAGGGGGGVRRQWLA